MVRFIRYHGLQVLVAVAAIAAAMWAYDRYVHLPNFAPVAPGKLYRCAQPGRTDLPQLKRMDVSTVINLRTEWEDQPALAAEREQLDRLHIRLVHMPMDTPIPSDRQVERFLRVVRGARGAAVLHCRSGADRTGILSAAYRVVVQGWPVHKAVDEMLRFGAARDPQLHKARLKLLHRLHQNRTQWMARTQPRGAWT